MDLWAEMDLMDVDASEGDWSAFESVKVSIVGNIGAKESTLRFGEAPSVGIAGDGMFFLLTIPHFLFFYNTGNWQLMGFRMLFFS